jgi:hypothetical protein
MLPSRVWQAPQQYGPLDESCSRLIQRTFGDARPYVAGGQRWF